MPKSKPSSEQSSSKTAKVVIAVVLLVVAAGGLVYSFSGTSPASVGGAGIDQYKAFYSDDDGKTTFVDTAGKTTPFDHNGKQAVEACCFTSDGGKTHFIGYLRRMTPQGRAALEAYKHRKEGDPIDFSRIMNTGQEVKRPGASNWVVQSDPAAQSILNPKSPDGKSAPDVFPYTPQ